MIVDQLKNASSYRGLGERFVRGFEYLRTMDFSQIAPGRHAIAGEELIAIVQSYPTKTFDQGKWESHRKYADIQCMISGAEMIGVAPIERMSVKEDYDEARDLMFFNGQGQFFTLSAGEFAIFLPQDVHMPSLVIDKPQTVLKVVMKVRL